MKKRKTYVKPETMPVHAGTAQFFCASIRPNAGASATQTNYDNKGEHDVGTVLFGDPSTVAPAKKGTLWDDDDDNK